MRESVAGVNARSPNGVNKELFSSFLAFACGAVGFSPPGTRQKRPERVGGLKPTAPPGFVVRALLPSLAWHVSRCGRS
jgi:hypothetical protein